MLVACCSQRAFFALRSCVLSLHIRLEQLRPHLARGDSVAPLGRAADFSFLPAVATECGASQLRLMSQHTAEQVDILRDAQAQLAAEVSPENLPPPVCVRARVCVCARGREGGDGR